MALLFRVIKRLVNSIEEARPIVRKYYLDKHGIDEADLGAEHECERCKALEDKIELLQAALNDLEAEIKELKGGIDGVVERLREIANPPKTIIGTEDWGELFAAHSKDNQTQSAN